MDILEFNRKCKKVQLDGTCYCGQTPTVYKYLNDRMHEIFLYLKEIVPERYIQMSKTSEMGFIHIPAKFETALKPCLFPYEKTYFLGDEVITFKIYADRKSCVDTEEYEKFMIKGNILCFCSNHCLHTFITDFEDALQFAMYPLIFKVSYKPPENNNKYNVKIKVFTRTEEEDELFVCDIENISEFFCIFKI